MAKQNATVQTADLAKLAKQINKSHEDCLRSARTSLSHAVNAGQLLNEAKTAVPHGGWNTWVEKECQFGLREAQRYMKVARELAQLEVQGPDVNKMTLTEVLGHLQKPRPKAVPEATTKDYSDACFRLSDEDRERRATRLEQNTPALPTCVEDEVAAVLDKLMAYFKQSIRTAVVKKIEPKIDDRSVDAADLAILLFEQLRARLNIAMLFDEPQSTDHAAGTDDDSASTTEANSAMQEQAGVTSAA